MHEPLDLARLESFPALRKLTYAASLRSTSDAAREQIVRDPPNVDETPWLVVAEEQTSGRGRGANTWWSAPEALTFTLVLRSELARLPSDEWPKLSLTAALAVIAAVESWTGLTDLELRWPNDVYVAGRKLCGILPEVIGPAGDAWLLVGIGLNVNNDTTSAPDEVRRRATSLVEQTGQAHDRTAILMATIEQLLAHIERLTNADPQLAIDWNNRCQIRGREVTIEQANVTTTGTCQGIDPAGQILIQTGEKTIALSSGTLTLVGQARRA